MDDLRSLTLPALVAVLVPTALLIGCRQPAADADASLDDVSLAYETVELPTGLDTLTSMAEAARRITACGSGCKEIIFVWTSRMPLSRSAIPNIERAAREVGAGLTLVGFEELERIAEGPERAAPESVRLASDLLEAGALAHAPALAVHDGTGFVGPAILGYKTAEAYASMIEGRLSGGEPAAGPDLAGAGPGALELPDDVDAPGFTDHIAIGVPGAYFKWVPGRGALAYESARRIYLLDLEDSRNRPAPGTIDFVPTPDGRYFVTPSDRNAGLIFADADDVFEAAESGRPASVQPIHLDRDMRDQYPSVGILARDEASTRYRVLTSWFEGLRYRDYEIVHAGAGTPATVRPLGQPVVPCRGMELSTPIMSQDGLEVAARDEASGTTKIYRFLDDGRCEEVLPLGMPTRKVAWHSSGRKLAFSTPRVRTASSGGGEPGIFVYDRDQRRVTRVADSDGASQLAFPDFVGDDAIVFMIPGRGGGQESRFRIVSPLP